MRLDYTDSCKRLHELGIPDCDPAPPMPDQMPSFDDQEPLGVNIFRTFLEGDFSDLTLPRTFFGRSEISKASFRSTDLSESRLCWNDFLEVDFENTILRLADLRCSIFEDTSFIGADLRQADLRRSTFKSCNFLNAKMGGAILTFAQKGQLSVSEIQIAEIDWRKNEGEEPGGG